LAKEFGIVLREEHHFDEAATFDLKNGLIQEAGWNFFVAHRFDEANAIADRLLAQERTAGALYLKAQVEYLGLEDIDAANAAIRQFTAVELLADEYASIALLVYLSRHNTDQAIGLLNAFPKDYINSQGWGGLPKRYWLGVAYEKAGRPEAARGQWQVALQQVQEGLKANGHDLSLLGAEALLLACLNEIDESGRVYLLFQSFSPSEVTNGDRFDFLQKWILLRLGRKEEMLNELSERFHAKGENWEVIHANARFSPMFDSLRGNPRFEKMLRENMPKYAKPFDKPVVK
jgi:hypothetical protein